MDLNQIYVFSKVVELGSFTRAAEFLGIPKSRISRNVSTLERELGVQLLYRTTRQIELTEAGRKYYQRSHLLIDDLDALNSEISKYSEDIAGMIRVTAPEDIALRFFPKLASEFMALYPRIQFDFYLTGRRVDLIKEPIDLALRVGHLKDSTLRARRIGEVVNILVASSYFLSKNLELTNITDLENIPCVGFATLGRREEWVLVANKKEVILKPNCNINTNTMDVLLQFILEHKGVGLLPTFIADEKIAKGELVHIFKGYHSHPLPLHFVTAPQKKMPLKVKRFMDFASEKLALSFS